MPGGGLDGRVGGWVSGSAACSLWPPCWPLRALPEDTRTILLPSPPLTHNHQVMLSHGLNACVPLRFRNGQRLALIEVRPRRHLALYRRLAWLCPPPSGGCQLVCSDTHSTVGCRKPWVQPIATRSLYLPPPTHPPTHPPAHTPNTLHRPLRKAAFNLNCAMWQPEFGYSEEEGRWVSTAVPQNSVNEMESTQPARLLADLSFACWLAGWLMGPWAGRPSHADQRAVAEGVH